MTARDDVAVQIEAPGLPEAPEGLPALPELPALLDVLERGVRAALASAGVGEGEVSLALVDDDAIRALNRDHLGRDRPTDVIAFALWEEGEPVVGDVYVGVEQARRQAAEEDVPLREELLRLAVHGTLHVLGHDHPEEPGGRAESPMYRLQETLVGEVLEGRGSEAGGGPDRRPGPGGRVPLALLALAAGASLASLTGACADAATDTPSFVLRDSAGAPGVTIAESARPAWGEGEGWTVAPEPALSLGVVEGDAAETFGRIVGAARLPDGRIVVADAQAVELRVFGSEGRHLRTLGGPGEGPGEFRNLTGVALRGDSVVAVHSFGRRLTWFDPGDGAVLASRPLPDRGSFTGLDGEGRPVILIAAVEPGERPPEGLVEMEYQLTAGFEAEDTLGTAGAGRSFYELSGSSVFVHRVPFGTTWVRAVGDRRVVTTGGERSEVPLYHLDRPGERTLVRWREARRPVTAADVERDREVALERFAQGRPDAERRIRDALNEVPVPDSMPAYDAALFDATGHLWLRRYRTLWEETSDWRVFDPEGRLLGTVTLPPGMEVLEIGRDHVLGRAEDELGVQGVRLHRLSRSSAGAS